MNATFGTPLVDGFFGMGSEPPARDGPSPMEKAQLLYEYCIASGTQVSETVHNLYIIAEHYAGDEPTDLPNPTVLNGIPPFFENLTAAKKAEYCYNQVTEALAREAMPVTVESLQATKRTDPDNPWSSYAGRFVRRVTIYVGLGVVALAALWYWTPLGEVDEIRWIAFGCLGSLLHLLNHALTTTRQQTFELNESRKIWPRLLLGGMLGFVLPWLLAEADLNGFASEPAAGAIAAFFAGYSVRFATGLIERMLEALFPEPQRKT